jgi:hypothetical protein
VKKQCTKVVAGLIFEFKKWFPVQELLNATGIIYPQYWLGLEAETTFMGHMAIIQAHFGYRKALGKHGRFVEPLLDPILVKLTLQNNCQATMLPPHDCNLTMRLWRRLASSAIVSQQLL